MVATPGREQDSRELRNHIHNYSVLRTMLGGAEASTLDPGGRWYLSSSQLAWVRASVIHHQVGKEHHFGETASREISRCQSNAVRSRCRRRYWELVYLAPNVDNCTDVQESSTPRAGVLMEATLEAPVGQLKLR